MHPYADKTKDVVEATMKGCGMNAFVWLVLVGVGWALGESNIFLWNIVVLILDTSFLSVSFVTWSLVAISLAFAIDEHSNGQIDYRVQVIIGVFVITLILGIYYNLAGISLSSITFP